MSRVLKNTRDFFVLCFHGYKFNANLDLMKIEFCKYQGTGNDFIIIHNNGGFVSNLSIEQIVKLCDRKFGIGSDGLILIEKTDEADFSMVFYNPDGTQSFCGNGSRCAVLFAYKMGLVQRKGSMLAVDGLHNFVVTESGAVRIQIRDLDHYEEGESYYFLDTGSPHYIVYREGVNELDIVIEAREVRYNKRFSNIGTNVNFVEECDDGLRVRTYERGVEDETLSCGSGVTAVALSHFLKRKDKTTKKIFTRGGELNVDFDWDNGCFKNIFLQGPATFVYKGEIDL